MLIVIEPRFDLGIGAHAATLFEYASAVELTATREIRRPAPEVFAFFADASNNPLWQQGMLSCLWTTQPPLRVGSTYEQRARFMGRQVTSTFVVVAFEPPRLIEIETLESTFPIKVRRSVEPTGPASCRVSAQISGGPEGRLMKLIEPVIGFAAQRSVDRDYDRLVQWLESSANSATTENSPSE